MYDTFLTTAQAAARLGITPQSLYAYVSRGLLTRERHPDGSRFDPLEIERFGRSRRRPVRAYAATPAPEGMPLAVIDTDIALIEDDELYYRGRPAAELARTQSYESVLNWLLGERGLPVTAFDAPSGAVRDARAVLRAMPGSATLRDRLQVAVVVMGAADPLRYAVSPDAVARVAGPVIAGMVAALPVAGEPADDGAMAGPADAESGLANTLWTKLTPLAPSPAGVRCLNAALVLLFDHDIAVSTLAARAAASARANPYAVVSTGLGALDSVLHGNASSAVHELLRRILETGDAERVIGDWVVSSGRGVPGFGQVLYRGVDPRASALLELIGELDDAKPAVAAARSAMAVMSDRAGAHPNVDFALAVLALGAGMRSDAGEAIFAIARSGGWLVHAAAEYVAAPLRLRPIGRYTGP